MYVTKDADGTTTTHATRESAEERSLSQFGYRRWTPIALPPEAAGVFAAAAR